jgi:uncharacterized membrane protein
MKRSVWLMIQRYLLTGLVVWLPVVVTLYVVFFIVGILDKSLELLPYRLQPTQLFGVHIPGFGVLLSLVVLFLTGMLVTNFLGQKLLSLGEKFLARIPFVRSLYAGVKQVMETVFRSDGKAFKKVFMIEYPRKGIWSLAFQTGEGIKLAEEKAGEPLLSLFVPTTPNPTSGFLLLVPKAEAHELDISVDQALKMVISLGVVQPAHKTKEKSVGPAK